MALKPTSDRAFGGGSGRRHGEPDRARRRRPHARASSWLLAGSVSALLIALVSTILTLSDYQRLAALYRPFAVALLLGAAAALAIGWAHPAPWLLATLLDLILIAIWSFAFARTLRATRDVPQPD